MEATFQSHRLSNGLCVSGPPKQPKERFSTRSSAPAPYTGGDVTRSGELGRMFNVDGPKSGKSGGLLHAPTRTDSFGGSFSRSGSFKPNAVAGSSNSTAGHAPPPSLKKKMNSEPLNKNGEPIRKPSGSQSGRSTFQNSPPQPPVLPITGLITSGPLNTSGTQRRVSGPLDSFGSVNMHGSSRSYNQGVTTLGDDDDFSVTENIRKPYLYALIVLFVMGFISGAYILEFLNSYIMIVVIFSLFCIVGGLFMWNSWRGREAIVEFIESYPDSELRTAVNGQYVKVSGVVTCGNVTLESSFQNVPGCVYTSTSLYEYRTWDSKPANSTHRRLTWGLRATEKHVVDFYITDFQSGLSALVKTGNGACVTPYVDEKVVIEVDPRKEDSNPDLVRWLGERNLSCEDRVMRLKEGYIKEGSIVSVMGVIKRNQNVVKIVPPPEPVTTGCQWTKCIFPAKLKGVVLSCKDSSEADVIV